MAIHGCNALPADFSKIPEGSPKDNVLASVAGTDAAREAVMDAQIPQTAKVDRKTANTSVTYDGEPQFKDIDGTSLQYAVNTPGSVVKYRGRYYTVDNGVWFDPTMQMAHGQLLLHVPKKLISSRQAILFIT